jgi:hypothetical protein
MSVVLYENQAELLCELLEPFWVRWDPGIVNDADGFCPRGNK